MSIWKWIDIKTANLANESYKGDVIAGIIGIPFGIVLIVSGAQGWGIFMILFSIVLILKPIWADDKQINTNAKSSYTTNVKSVTHEKSVSSDLKPETTKVPLSIHDFLDISSENGIIKAIVKDRCKNMPFMRYSFLFDNNTQFIKKWEGIICLSDDVHSLSDIIYSSPDNGILCINEEFSSNHFLNLGAGQLLFELNTNEESIRQYRIELEIKLEQKREELEKQQIACKLKEKERRRQLEKQVRQELIEKGEIMPAAGRAPIPREIVDAVYTRDGGRCVYCGSTDNLQVDHIIPHSKGGADTIENLQILCQKCNIAKSNKIG
jgi:hypothetical protein